MHYDDPNQDLQDLYFIDPQWLCELMAQIVTLQEVNRYIRNGILNLDDLPQIFKGELFPYRNAPQFIRLLNRFQIACSLDENRVLIPSKLRAGQPEEATNDDLPFITLKRIHSMPCIPFGFWSRLISRLLFYMKDMLSGGENFNRQEYSSPFQLDPFCCRCPLEQEGSTTGGLADSDNEGVATFEASLGGSFENLPGSPGDFRGLVRFFSTHRTGTFINGRFFSHSDLEGESSRSDSGFEYSSDDDDEARARAPSVLTASYPSARSKDSSWRNERVFKHGTDPGTHRRRDEINDLESETPKSDSAVPILQEKVSHGDWDENAYFGASRTSSEQGSCVTLTSNHFHISPHLAEGPPAADNEGLSNFDGKDVDLVDSSRPSELTSSAADEDSKVFASKDTCLEYCSERLDGHLELNLPENYNSDDSDSVPYHSATSRACTPDPLTHEKSNGHHKDPSLMELNKDPEIRPFHEDPGTDGLNQFQSLTESCLKGAVFHRSVSEEAFQGDSCEVASNHSATSSESNSSSSDKESDGESFHTSSSRGSNHNEAWDTSTEIRTVVGDEEIAGKKSKSIN